jgi:hypothetical protein
MPRTCSLRPLLPGAALIAASWGTGSVAHATEARIQALQANPAFIDDTDVLLYPSTIGGVDAGANLNYSGGVNAGATWGGEHLLWMGTDSFPPASRGPGAATPFSMVYGQGDDATGWLGRTSWQQGRWTVGGAWGKGAQGRVTDNLAAGGDIHIMDSGKDSPDLGFDLHARGRKLQDGQFLSWNGMLSIFPDVKNEVTGGILLGPRWKKEGLRAALGLGSNLRLTNTKNATAAFVDVPAVNLATEYELREWWTLRGSATVGWNLGANDIGDFDKTKQWSARSAGVLGMGFKHEDRARLDMSIAPNWAVQGPNLLSGTTNPMFYTVSGRVLL